MVLTNQLYREFPDEVLRYFNGAIYRERPTATQPFAFVIFLESQKLMRGINAPTQSRIFQLKLLNRLFAEPNLPCFVYGYGYRLPYKVKIIFHRP